MIKKLQNMNRLEIASVLEENKIAILPIGAIEQHGHHLPLGTDALLATKISELVAEKLDAVVLPTFYYGYSWVWKDIAGTITLQQPVLQSVLKDICISVANSGFEKLLIINGHEANSATLKYLVREMDDISDLKILNLFYPGLSDNYHNIFESETWYGMFHADEFETSLMLSHYEELVDLSLAKEEYPLKPLSYSHDATSIGELSRSGVYGNPTLATKNKGDTITRIVVNNIVQIVKSLD